MTVAFAALREKSSEYLKNKEGKASEKSLMSLVWDIKQLSELDEEGRKIMVNCLAFKEKAQDQQVDWVTSNMAHQLSTIRKALESYVSRVSRYRRIPATHILVIMISPEERNKKPYALPIQCVPYVGLGDMQVRDLVDKVIEEMTKRGMKVAGMSLA